MTKTKAQLEKKKRETEKRKNIEKAVLKIAAGMPDDVEQKTAAPGTASRAGKEKA